jgi:hypothetical protein
MNLKMGRSPDIEIIFRKAWSFIKNFERGWLPDIETVS